MTTQTTVVASEGAPDPMATTAPVLEVEHLRVVFRQGEKTTYAVNDVSLSVPLGRTLAVIGESGSGKSVMSRALMGLLPTTATITGSVRLLGQEILGLPENDLRQRRGKDMAMIFQDPTRSLNPTMKIGTQIAENIRIHEKDVSRKEAIARAVELLRVVRVPAPDRRVEEYPHQLSGGMRQRVMIAIALACQPKLLIADEATTALDVTTQAQVMDLLLDLQQQFGMSMILISHDMGIAATYADDVAVMYAGDVVERAPVTELFGHVRMPYTRMLLDAVPRLDRPAHSLIPVTAARPPDLSKAATSCRFAARCPRVQDDCLQTHPPLEEHEDKHAWACFHPIPLERTSA
jgi:oligopeptide/dipeptide ABC transporter ATP-binding protein